MKMVELVLVRVLLVALVIHNLKTEARLIIRMVTINPKRMEIGMDPECLTPMIQTAPLVIFERKNPC